MARRTFAVTLLVASFPSACGGDDGGVSSADTDTDPSVDASGSPSGAPTTASDSTDDAPPDDASSSAPGSATGEPGPECGNGDVEESEECDDGDLNGMYGQCDATCEGIGEFCGDGIVNGPEDCDDQNVGTGDGCNDCVFSLTPLWVYEDEEFGAAADVAWSSAGEVAAGGYVTDGSGGFDGHDGWLLKLDDDGNELERRVDDNLDLDLQDAYFGIAFDLDMETVWAVGWGWDPDFGFERKFLRTAFGMETFRVSYARWYTSIAMGEDGAAVAGRLFQPDGQFSLTFFEPDASFAWEVPLLSPDLCTDPLFGPFIDPQDGTIVLICSDPAGGDYWRHVRFTTSGTVPESEQFLANDTLRAADLDQDGAIYFAGGDNTSSYVARVSADLDWDWAVQNPIDGAGATWHDIAVAPDGESVVVVGDSSKGYAAASRVTVDGELVIARAIEEIEGSFTAVAVDGDGDVYVAGRIVDRGFHPIVARLTP